MYKTFLFLVVIFSFQFSVAQQDSIQKKPISGYTKSLQFGEEYLQARTELTPINFSKITLNKIDPKLIYNPERDPKRLVYNTGLFLGAAAASFGILWVMPESITNWDKEQMKEDGIFNRWKDNVKAGPVWDEDDIFLNWIMHPWAGAVYYMSARGSGFKWWESFAYSTLMSTFFWEYGIEAFAEIPSWQDLFITPILGSALGEQFFRWKGKIIAKDRRVLNSRFIGGTSLFLMDPFNEVVDWLGYKTKNKIATYSLIAPIDYDFSTHKSIWGLQVVMQF